MDTSGPLDSPPQRKVPPTAASRAADLAVLIDAVREAGALAMRYFRREPWRRRKADGTEVSEADLAVDVHLRTTLLGARPDYGWLSEETPDNVARLARSRVWMVDPIDGTRAFLQGVPEWTICAALTVDGHPVLAAVYNPPQDAFFHAVAGGGAHLDGTSVRVSGQSGIEGASLLVSGGFVRRKDWERPWPPVRTRWINSVAYRLALVAAGDYDATVSLSAKCDWDLAAAHLLVQEAGGCMTTHRGEAMVYNRAEPVHRSVLAANPALHGALLARMRGVELR